MDVHLPIGKTCSDLRSGRRDGLQRYGRHMRRECEMRTSDSRREAGSKMLERKGRNEEGERGQRATRARRPSERWEDGRGEEGREEEGRGEEWW